MPQSNEKMDRRVIYTKLFLREALLELIKTKPIAKITPTELCRYAKINRNTFYTHYNSPEELLESIEDELFEQIKQSIERSLKNDRISTLLTEICRAIYKNSDLCNVLFTENGDKDFLRRIIYLAHDKTIAEWKLAGLQEDEEQIEMLYCYSVNGSVSVIQQWILAGMKKNPEEIAQFIERASYAGLRGFLSK
ncbi:TetR/AcrR family transcriptional regulator [Clostridium merdae]|uniref:TetR/AcrR family transcriptional regulator n=1 Tax=Clostridium merdae TaxID=1958780 RepID=UPI000A268FE9|nr:TetR/AcrR family transcriptional regulator [Clostridium merdae]